MRSRPDGIFGKDTYSTKTDRWLTLAPMPHGRHGFGGDNIGENAYFVGGSLTPGDGGATDQLLMFHFPEVRFSDTATCRVHRSVP